MTQAGRAWTWEVSQTAASERSQSRISRYALDKRRRGLLVRMVLVYRGNVENMLRFGEESMGIGHVAEGSPAGSTRRKAEALHYAGPTMRKTGWRAASARNASTGASGAASK